MYLRGTDIFKFNNSKIFTIMKTLAITFNFMLIIFWVVVAPIAYPIIVLTTAHSWRVMPIRFGKYFSGCPAVFGARCWWHKMVEFATMPWEA